MDKRQLADYLEILLREDVGSGDITSSFTPNPTIRAYIRANSAGFVSGLHELTVLLRRHGIKVIPHVADGGGVRRGQRVVTLVGRARKLLSVERTALNLICRMSGITTLTRRYVDELRTVNARCRVAATRKTAPGLRYFDKRAVVLGGGVTHRMGLYDMVLIKDNHLRLFSGDVKRALKAAANARVRSKIEIEVTSARGALVAAENGADMIMFDNMKPSEIKRAIKLLEGRGLRKKAVLEVSGGVNLRNIRSYGRTGVDWISVGRITHSAPSVDFSLEVKDPLD